MNPSLACNNKTSLINIITITYNYHIMLQSTRPMIKTTHSEQNKGDRIKVGERRIGIQKGRNLALLNFE